MPKPQPYRHVIAEALQPMALEVDTLNQLIGPDDLVAVMTPDMSAKDVTFARRTTTIDGILSRAGWAERNTSLPPDQQDQMYATCYPNSFRKECQAQNGIAAEMIDRRHERISLDALHDLVRFLRGVREERKAILTITDGWLLFRPNDGLMRSLDCAKPPVAPPLGIDPRNGRLTTNERAMGADPLARCEADRHRLAQLDSEREFKELMDEATGRTSFYPIDPRGLAVFDTPLVRTDVPGPLPPIVPPRIDQAMLKAREGSLRAAAALTDGMVVVGSNDLAAGLKRITNDLSSYYLLGYYSSGKQDGKFHAISVRVKRPGVHVRARRGYLAGRAGDVANSVGGVAAPVSAAASSIAAAASSAIAALAVSTRDQPSRLHVVAGWKNGPDSKPTAVFWTVGEVTDRIPGTDLEVVVTTADGSIVGSAAGRIVPGATSAILAVAAGRSIEPGPYQVRLRSRTGTGSETLTTDVSLPAAAASSGAVFVRRGPSTGNKDAPTADFRFRRSDRLRVEFPAGDAPTTARLLDRTGKPMSVPVVTAMRHDADGSQWVSGELALAPLAPGDYVIEIADKSETRMVAFRVVP